MKQKNILIILILVIGMVFVGCSAKQEDVMSYDMAESANAPMSEAEGMAAEGMYYGDGDEKAAQEDVVDFSEKIIYNVNMGIVADDPVEASKLIKVKVNEMGGYISSSYTYKNEDSANYVNIQVRVPSKGLNDMTEFIYSIAEVESENMYTDNITENYYDTVARLEHEKLQEKQLQEIMEKAETINDIIIVRQELSRVQEIIEVYKGRIRRWDSLVDYSTLDISIRPTPTIDNNKGLMRLITWGETRRGIARALQNSWIFVRNFFSFIFRLIATLLLPAVIVVPIVILIVKLSNRNKTKRKDKEQDNKDK